MIPSRLLFMLSKARGFFSLRIKHKFFYSSIHLFTYSSIHLFTYSIVYEAKGCYSQNLVLSFSSIA